MIHPLAAAALLLASAQSGPGQPARPCITHEEAADVAVTLLPFLIDGMVQRCRPHLAAGAFLLTGAADWSARLRRDAAPRRASALRGISKMGDVASPSGAGGEAAFDFIAQMVAAGLTGNIQPENCGRVDTIAQSLSPLPTENIANLVGAGLGLAMTADAGGDDDSDADNDDDNDNDGRRQNGEAGDDGPPICRS